MSDPFLTFQKYNDLVLATEMSDELKKNGIESVIENAQKFFDVSFANNTFESDIILKIKPEDFSKANRILDDLFKQNLNTVDKEYYLFDFSEDELKEIIAKPDEWGHFDYQLAQKILKDRGEEIIPEKIDELRNERMKDISKPEAAPKFWIYLGYITAILGGFLGMIISLMGVMTGATIAFFKKTLPDGRLVYIYGKKERNHGIVIFILGILGFIFWLLIRLRPFH